MKAKRTDWLFVGVVVLVMAIAPLFFPVAWHTNLLLFYGAQIVLLLILVGGHAFLTKKPVLDYGLNLKTSYVPLLYVLSFFFIIAAVGRILVPSFDKLVFDGYQLGTYFWTLIPVFIVAALYEEVLYRGTYQSSLQKYYTGWPLIIFFSLHFAFIHFNLSVGVVNTVAQVISALLAGAILIIVYMRTNNLLLTFLAHVITNLLAIGQIYLRFMTSFEWVLWIVWAIVAVVFFKPAISYFFTKESWKAKKLEWYAYILLVVFASLPLWLPLLAQKLLL